MSDLFISYASEDRPWAKILAEALRQEKWDVWWDRTIPAGRRYHKVIEDALEEARCVLVVWSHNSVESDWVRAEAGSGMARDALVPVSIDDSEPPLVFQQLQTANLSDWSGDRDDPLYRKLVRDIGSLLGAAPAADDSGPEEVTPERPEEALERFSQSVPPPNGDGRPWLRPALIGGALVAAIGLIFWFGTRVGGGDKPDEALPRIVRFSVEPPEVRAGQTATVRWATENADKVVFDSRGATTPDEVRPSGKRLVEPEKDTVYLLRASNASGEVEERASVSVVTPSVPPAAKPRVEVAVTPTKISQGQRAKLTWNSSSASRVEMQGVGRVDASGSKIVSPRETTDYVVVATNETGTAARASARLSVTPKLEEDCVSFDPERATTKQAGSRWLIVDGTHNVFGFGNQSEARQALAIIRKYRANQVCYVGRPRPSFSYLLVSGRAPRGALPGEDCLSFDPSLLKVVDRSGRWVIGTGNRSMFSFDDKDSEAREALAIIKHHDFSQSCFVGRPDPSLTYMRR